jgi:hypothetical protein
MPANKAVIRAMLRDGYSDPTENGNVQRAYVKGWAALERLLLDRAHELEEYDNAPDRQKALTMRDELRIIREGHFETRRTGPTIDGRSLYRVGDFETQSGATFDATA